MDKLLSTRSAAEILGISVVLMERMRTQGQGRPLSPLAGGDSIAPRIWTAWLEVHRIDPGSRGELMRRPGPVSKTPHPEDRPRAVPRLLPLKEAAEWLGLTTWAIRERAWAGQIPVVQFPGGRKMYFDINDLEAFIADNKRVIS